MRIDVLDNPDIALADSQTLNRMNGLPLMHQHHMRLATDLRMDTNRKDERVILSIRKIKLLPPQLLNQDRKSVV